MNREEFLKAFEQLSTEDRNLVRAEISRKGTSGESCCTPSMKEQLSGMIKKIETSGNPMAMFQEMMRMCGERMTAKCGS